MLILTRKPGQRITIEPDARLDLRTPIGEVFADGPIEVSVGRVDGLQIKLAIHAHPCLQILRAELRTETGDRSSRTDSRGNALPRMSRNRRRTGRLP